MYNFVYSHRTIFIYLSCVPVIFLCIGFVIICCYDLSLFIIFRLRVLKSILLFLIHWYLSFVLFLLEFLSHLFRFMSVSFRIFANLVSGHIVQHLLIYTSFLLQCLTLDLVLLWLFLTIICIFEFIICSIQITVFTTLSLIYLQ